MDMGLDRAAGILRAVQDDPAVACLVEVYGACGDEAMKAELAGELCTTVAMRGCDALAAIALDCGAPIWSAVAAMAMCLCGAQNDIERTTFSDALVKLLPEAIGDAISDLKPEKLLFLILLATTLHVRF